MNTGSPVSVFWFRRDLRLFDNHGLFLALSSAYPVLPVFIFDTDILHSLDADDKRVTFIHHTLLQLKQTVESAGSTLYVVHDTPLRAFEQLCAQFTIKAVFTNHDYEPYAIHRDRQIGELLKSKGVSFITCKDQVLFEMSDVMKRDGTPYTVYSPYARAWKQRMAETGIPEYPSETLIERFVKAAPSALPSLAEMAFTEACIDVPPPAVDRSKISDYAQRRNFPSVDGTSRMSVHLRFGTVSVRQLVALASASSEQWLNELIWREFFMMILYHYPQVVNESFKKKYDKLQWRNNEQEFEKWCRGETGYPLVDAGMHELNETGFLHNRVRMVVASFLTKHLLIDWRWGEAYFAEKLLDYELASNNGNWQWVAGSGCDAAPYFRIFNPAQQLKKFDPQLKYVNKWIDLSGQYIAPVVDHDFARKRALEVYKKAVASGE